MLGTGFGHSTTCTTVCILHCLHRQKVTSSFKMYPVSSLISHPRAPLPPPSPQVLHCQFSTLVTLSIATSSLSRQKVPTSHVGCSPANPPTKRQRAIAFHLIPLRTAPVPVPPLPPPRRPLLPLPPLTGSEGSSITVPSWRLWIHGPGP